MIIAGQVIGRVLGSTDIYNPETYTMSSTDLPGHISNGGLARGTNGKLFLIGGENRLTVRFISNWNVLLFIGYLEPLFEV